MKILLCISLVLALHCALLGAILGADAPAPAPAPRIVALSGETYPAARIIAIDAAGGVVTFAYLKADGKPADSGNSIAKFTPPAPIPPVNPGDPVTYPEISDAVLAAAIQAAG